MEIKVTNEFNQKVYHDYLQNGEVIPEKGKKIHYDGVIYTVTDVRFYTGSIIVKVKTYNHKLDFYSEAYVGSGI